MVLSNFFSLLFFVPLLLQKHVSKKKIESYSFKSLCTFPSFKHASSLPQFTIVPTQKKTPRLSQSVADHPMEYGIGRSHPQYLQLQVVNLRSEVMICQRLALLHKNKEERPSRVFSTYRSQTGGAKLVKGSPIRLLLFRLSLFFSQLFCLALY